MMKVQVAVGRLQRAPVDRDPVLAAVDAATDQPGLFQHLEVLGDAVLRHGERLTHLTDRELAGLAQERDDLATSGVGQAVKDAIELLLGAGLGSSAAHAGALVPFRALALKSA